ncbi:MAG: hypothetical protein HN975_16695 [Anaerolineae bacterium]|jgi:hypothetical protein|nr:hypothetical protein [Anaerolineae bacterium]
MAEKVTENFKLTPRQRKALEALTQAGTVTAAAEAAGVARKTVYAWLLLPEFDRELNRATAAALGELSRRLVGMSGQAADTIQDVMNDPDASPAVRLRAADTGLNRLLQLRQLVDLEERVSRLEAAKNG